MWGSKQLSCVSMPRHVYPESHWQQIPICKETWRYHAYFWMLKLHTNMFASFWGLLLVRNCSGCHTNMGLAIVWLLIIFLHLTILITWWSIDMVLSRTLKHTCDFVLKCQRHATWKFQSTGHGERALISILCVQCHLRIGYATQQWSRSIHLAAYKNTLNTSTCGVIGSGAPDNWERIVTHL